LNNLIKFRLKSLNNIQTNNLINSHLSILYRFFGPGFDPAFFAGAAFDPFLATPFPAASSAFLLSEVLEVDTPDDVKKLEKIGGRDEESEY
jgi:hypothetical protein